jgi:hypothetical protein
MLEEDGQVSRFDRAQCNPQHAQFLSDASACVNQKGMDRAGHCKRWSVRRIVGKR